MKIINYLRITIWYLKNPKFLPNLIFIIQNKIKEIFLSGDIKFTKKKRIVHCDHKKFYKINFIKRVSFKKKKIYLRSINENKKIIKSYGGEADLDLLFCICNKIKSRNFLILETGVALGWSSFVFLFFLKKKKGKLFSIDMPYVTKKNFDYIGSIVPNFLKKNWQLYKIPDFMGLKKIKKKNIKFDLIHYDSDKSYYGRKRSYEILWDLLKKKGYFISDDISDNYAFFNFVQKKNLEKDKDFFILKFKKKFIGVVIK